MASVGLIRRAAGVPPPYSVYWGLLCSTQLLWCARGRTHLSHSFFPPPYHIRSSRLSCACREVASWWGCGREQPRRRSTTMLRTSRAFLKRAWESQRATVTCGGWGRAGGGGGGCTCLCMPAVSPRCCARCYLASWCLCRARSRVCQAVAVAKGNAGGSVGCRAAALPSAVPVPRRRLAQP